MQNVEPTIFLQTRPTTCGIACLMMALDALGTPTRLTKGEEGKLFRELRARGFDLVPSISLATHARKAGRHAGAVIQDGPVDFWDYWRSANFQMYEEQERAYANARAVGTTIERKPISVETLRKSLELGSLVIAGIDFGEGIKHALLVYGWAEGSFLVVDPLSGKRRVPEEQLLQEMTMDFGRWFIEIR